jgi:peroxiredoxin
MRYSAILISIAAVAVGSSACAAQRAQAKNPLIGKAAPAFSAKGTDGKTYSLDSVGKKPMIIAFWKNPCPHNPRASKLINSVVAAYKGKVNFVGVVNSDGPKAAAFKQQFGPGYEFLNDGSKSIIKDYNIKPSLQFVVISPDKKVQAVIGGYGKDAMNELNAAMAKAAGVKAANVDLSGAPNRTTYG